MPADAPVTRATFPPSLGPACSLTDLLLSPRPPVPGGPCGRVQCGDRVHSEEPPRGRQRREVAPMENRPPAWLWPRAAYVHVPFCAHRCSYCDFAIATGQGHLAGPYLDALAAELAALGSPQPVATLFLGG